MYRYIYMHSHYVYSVPAKAKAQCKALWKILGGIRHRQVLFSGNLGAYGDLKPFTIPEMHTFLHHLVVEIG